VLWIKGLTAAMLEKGRGEMVVMPAVTAVLIHNSAMNTGTDCGVFSRG